MSPSRGFLVLLTFFGRSADSETWLMGVDGGIRTLWREVKFNDPRKTNKCESKCLGHSHQSGTKVRGSKTIRYRRSP